MSGPQGDRSAQVSIRCGYMFELPNDFSIRNKRGRYWYRLLRNTHRVILAESIEGSNASKNAADSKPFLLKGRNDGALRPPKSAAVWGFKTGPRMTKRRETSLERSARKGTARHLPSFLDIGQHRRDETATYPHGPLVGVKQVPAA